MTNTDMVLIEIDEHDNAIVSDLWSTGFHMPTRDLQQNY